MTMQYRSAPERSRLTRTALLVAAALAALQAQAQVAQPPAARTPAQDGAEADLVRTEEGSALPMSKAVVEGAQLEQTQQDGYAEAVRSVAGVSPANSKGSANDSINIRGIKLNLFANYRLNGGLPVTGVITVPTEDKQRVETLKGANALLFGIASPAGIINLVTKRAGERDVTSVGIAGNSFGQVGVSADIGRRFGAEKQLGLRVSASGVHLNNGVVGGHGDFLGVGFDYRVDSRLAFQGDYETYSKNVVQQAGISLLPAVNGKVPITPIPDPRRLLSGPWAVLNAHTENKQVRADFAVTDRVKLMAEVGRSNSGRDNYTLRIGGYNIATGAGGTVTVNTALQAYENTFARTEVHGDFSTWTLKHELTVGLSKTQRDADNVAQNQATLGQKQNIFDPIPLAPPVFTKAPTAQFQSSKDDDVYVYDTVAIGPKFRVLAGVRQLKDTEVTGGKSNTSTITSPAYGLLYDLVPGVTAFASVMQGLEAGSTAPVTAVNANEILPSAISKQKEAGVRVTRKTLSASASYFQISRANAVTDPVTRIFSNNGEIDYKGLEFTATWRFLPRWSATASGLFLHARQRTPDPTFNGFAPENTPTAVGNVSFSYQPGFAPGLSLSAGASSISKRFVNNQEQGTIPGYTLYSVGAGYSTQIVGRRVNFQVNVDNVANKRYWNSVQTGTYGIGMDRSVKFNARVDL